MIKVLSLTEEPAKSAYKYNVILEFKDKDGQIGKKKIRFGAKGYNDYTIFLESVGKVKAEQKKDAYLARHAPKEDWTLSGIFSKGFWSRWILWNLATPQDSLEYTKRKFNLA